MFGGGGEEVASRPRNDHGGDASLSKLTSESGCGVSSNGASCSCECLLVADGHERLRLLQLGVVPHAMRLSWNTRLIVAYQVVRRVPVHQHREYVRVGVRVLSTSGSRQSREHKSLVGAVFEVKGWFLIVIGGRGARTQHVRGDVSAVVLQRVWRSLFAHSPRCRGGRSCGKNKKCVRGRP